MTKQQHFIDATAESGDEGFDLNVRAYLFSEQIAAEVDTTKAIAMKHRAHEYLHSLIDQVLELNLMEAGEERDEVMEA